MQYWTSYQKNSYSLSIEWQYAKEKSTWRDKVEAILRVQVMIENKFINSRLLLMHYRVPPWERWRCSDSCCRGSPWGSLLHRCRLRDHHSWRRCLSQLPVDTRWWCWVKVEGYTLQDSSSIRVAFACLSNSCCHIDGCLNCSVYIMNPCHRITVTWHSEQSKVATFSMMFTFEQIYFSQIQLLRGYTTPGFTSRLCDLFCGFLWIQCLLTATEHINVSELIQMLFTSPYKGMSNLFAQLWRLCMVTPS